MLRRILGTIPRPFAALLAVALVAAQVAAAPQARGSLAGSVTDEAGARVPAARVVLVDAAGAETERLTDEQGRYSFRNIPAGSYTLRVTAEGFDEFASEGVAVGPGGTPSLDVTLAVLGVAENVTVTADDGIAAEPDRNADAVVLKEREIAALPDDPDQLAEALQEMAGPGAGPGGGQFYVDGFSGGRLPPKSSIREIRINSNPFSAEFDRIGFGRIEILTKPGSDRFRGQVFGAFSDESLNARNAFALDRPAEQERRYGGNVSGPLGKRASYFFDFDRREEDEANTIAATVLDAALNPTFFAATLPEVERRMRVSPRFDLQLGERQTLVFRYDFDNRRDEGQGVGGYSLPSRAFSAESRSHTFSFTDTFIVSPSLISETRFQYARRSSESEPAVIAGPAVVVLDAFSENASSGVVSQRENRFELHQNFSFVRGNHTVRAGARLRGIDLETSTTSNFVGTFTFAGDVERDPATGAPLPGSETISSLEQYRRVLLGLPGYRPSQFSIIYGEPLAGATQYDVGLFVQDDWRVRPELTLSMGLRYENQTNAGDELNFAPRLGVAYSISGADGRPTTVIRAGFGVFFDRIGEDLTLDADRYDGLSLRQYIVPRPAFFGAAPTEAELEAFALPASRRELAALDTPYTIQGSASVERQLPWDISANATYIWGRGVHQLRSRNINAPDPATGLRPFGDDAGNVFAVEATGTSRRNQFRFGLSRRSGRVTVFSNYGIGWVRSDADGSGSFPANPFDLSEDYGRSSEDSRHFFFLGSSIQGPWGLQFNPHLFARSGRPYNVTLGRDLNGDSVFNDRPSFATAEDFDAVATPFGLLDPTPEPGEPLIPRNIATGPSIVRLNLAVSKTFGFGERSSAGAEAGGGPGGPGGHGGPGMGRGGGRGGFGGRGGGFGGGASDSRYSLTVSVRAQNILNQVNFVGPSGVLTSPTFGIPNAALSGRQIETQLRFSF